MSTANNPHNRAMDLVESAVLERMRGNTERTSQIYAEALELELTAIRELEERNDRAEPTWSILHRSAGWMAFNSNQLRRAEQIASKAMAGEPHPEIAEELRDLLEQVNSQRHLALRGVTLTADEMQMNLSGPAVGFGFVRISDLVGRVNDLTTFILRIVEHKKNRPFRERGVPRKDVTDGYPTFFSVPRAGSFSATLTIGQPTEQLSFPDMLSTNAIVDEFMDVMELAKSSQMAELRHRIPETPYLRNFISLARKLAPDGERIRQVGFTTISGGTERYLSIDTPADEFPLPPIAEESLLVVEPEPVEIHGVLLYADAINDNVIRVVDSSGRKHSVEVPEGMMSDIVRPMWNSNVTITGLRTGGGVMLQTIHDNGSN